MNYYQLSPHVLIEFFDEDAVILVADRDVIMTVNQMAAQIFQHARQVVGNETFNRSACVDFLLENYQLSGQEAAGLRQGIILKNHVA